MPFTVSPGVLTREIDLTTIVPTISTVRGGFAGPFKWGPIEDPENGQVSTEQELKDRFHIPDDNTFVSYFSCLNFIGYGSTAEISRIANTSAKNASTANTVYAAGQEGECVLIKNRDAYEATYDPSTGGTSSGTYGPFVAKYAGDRGNNLKVSLCGPDKPAKTLTGTVQIDGSSGLLSGTNTSFFTEVRAGDALKFGSDVYVVNNVMNTSGTDTAFLVQASSSVTAKSSGTSGTVLIRSGFEEPAENMVGTIAIAASGTTVTGTGTQFALQLTPGDMLTFTDAGGTELRRKVLSIASKTSLTLASAIGTSAVSGATFSREWEYRADPGTSTQSSDSPTTSAWASSIGAENDEIHLVIVDEDGGFGSTPTSSTKDQILKRYSSLSVAANHPTSFYKSVLNMADHIWWMAHPTGGSEADSNDTSTSAWGVNANGSTKFNTKGWVRSYTFAGGIDGNLNLTDSDYNTGYNVFKEPVVSDAAVLFMGNASAAVCTNAIQNVAEVRKDMMVFCSPERSDVVGTTNQAANIVDFRNALPSSSYGVLDSGYKKQHDIINNVWRHIPLNADIAGITVRTELSAGAFFSPAGFTRGNVMNASNLPYNPSEADRDRMYTKGINSVVRFPAQGTILFGDKTLLNKPNAFDRINVRRLFITLEKSISRAAQQSMFEFNDDFTRAQFVSIVEPFLRDIQARGGITDFQVVCDGSNNPPSVVDANQFVGAIYVKPARSINFVELSFVAVRSGVEFSEVVQGV